MKKFGFLYFLVTMVAISLTSSTCRNPPPIDDEPIVINPEDTVKPDKNPKGNLILTVRAISVAGSPISNATVKLAYTFDSVTSQKYFDSQVTNDSGKVTFNGLPTYANGPKSYFVYAERDQGGQTWTTTNPNGPGYPELKIRKDQTLKENTWVTEP